MFLAGSKMSKPKTLQILLFALAFALRSSFGFDDPTVVPPGDIDYTTQSFTEVADGVFYARAYDSFSDQVVVEGKR